MSSLTRATMLDGVSSAAGNTISRRDLRQSIVRPRDILKAPFHDFPIRDEILCQYLPISPEMNILEIGPGSGFTAFWLSRHVSKMTIVDVTPEVVADLRKQLQAASNLRFGSGNLVRNEFVPRLRQRFDVAFALDVFEYVPEPALALKTLGAVLRPEGQLFLTFPNVVATEGDGVTRFNSPQEIEALLRQAGFRCWKIFAVRKSRFASVTYRLMHEWPLLLIRNLRRSNKAGRPQTYEGTWAFKKRAQLSRAKFVMHLYWIMLGRLMRLGGPVFEMEPASDDLLGFQLVVHAWK